jgi:acyl dehydratase
VTGLGRVSAGTRTWAQIGILPAQTATTTLTALPPPTVTESAAITPPAPRNIRWYWEDFPVDSVREFGAMQVTREGVLAFASQFDPQPFHMDDAAAANSLFGKLSASGWHTCAMAMRMMCDDYLLESSSLGSPGIDNLRWMKPVFPGDTLSIRLTVLESRPMASRPTVGLVSSKWEVLNQHREVVLSMQGWGMFGRRTG